jgi:hypothetical protein
VTPSLGPRGDAADAPGAPGAPVPAEAGGRPRATALPEGYLAISGLRERGWTDAMVREYLGEPDTTRPNPRYWGAAPMKLYLAERAEAAETSPGWAARKALAARRRAAGAATSARKRAEAEALGRQPAAGLVAHLATSAQSAAGAAGS